MPKHTSKVDSLLQELSQRLTEDELRELAARILGHFGGKQGGKARAASLTQEQRSEIARKAAAARWKSQ